METIRPIPAPAVAARAARPRHASHLNRSLLALIFAPRMTETEAAEYAQGRSSAAVAAIGAWALAVMAALALAAVISAHVFAVRAELYGMDYSRALDVHRFWVEWSTVAWGCLLMLILAAAPLSLVRRCLPSMETTLHVGRAISARSFLMHGVLLMLAFIVGAFALRFMAWVPAELITMVLHAFDVR